jgi:hypothetical protein
MEIARRTIGETLVIDFGPLPQTTAEYHDWGQAIQKELSGHDGPVILDLHDAEGMRAIHIGILVEAAKKSGRLQLRDQRPSVVSSNPAILEAFNTSCHPIFRAYETIEDVLAPGNTKSSSLRWIVFAVVIFLMIKCATS